MHWTFFRYTCISARIRKRYESFCSESTSPFFSSISNPPVKFIHFARLAAYIKLPEARVLAATFQDNFTKINVALGLVCIKKNIVSEARALAACTHYKRILRYSASKGNLNLVGGWTVRGKEKKEGDKENWRWKQSCKCEWHILNTMHNESCG